MEAGDGVRREDVMYNDYVIVDRRATRRASPNDERD